MKAHGDVTQGGIFKFGAPVWGKRSYKDGPYEHSFETCSYCGSISIAALEHWLAMPQVKAEVADMKYGWPHKIYLSEVPNDCAGQERVMGSESGPGYRREIKGPAPATQQVKFYTEHLVDLDDADFERVTALLVQKTRVQFVRQDNNMLWKLVPH